MKQRFAVLVLVALAAALCSTPAFTQSTGTVKGVCKDLEGKPINGAVVQFTSQETGRKYELKTNNKGEYFSLGVAPGKYNVALLRDGKEVFHYSNVPVGLDEVTIDFDLQKEQAKGAQQQGMTPEQLKKIQEQQEKAAKETNTVKALNEKLAAATQSSAAGDYDAAIKVLTEGTEMDATRDLLWFKLGDAYRASAPKQTDPAEKTKRLEAAIADYQKAIDLKQKASEAAPKTPESSKQLAAYYNNLGDAYARAGKGEEATKALTQAAQLDPPNAAMYYFNLGAVLTNVGKMDDAIAAFDKAIAADPNRADAYYFKGVNLMGKATLKGDKMVAPDGTSEAFNKYLELQPTGQFAEPAKQMLASIGATVETSYGKKKSTKK
jgi:tetratricopeptide (TPR) repeat protein